MNFSKKQFSTILLHMVVLAFWLIPANIKAADSMDCVKCHKEYIADEFRQSFIHQPFLEKNCRFCHSPDWVENAAESEGKAQFPHKIKKLVSADIQTQVHLFAIPKELAPNMLFIEATNDSNKSFKTKLRVPPFDTLKTASSDATPPEITKVQVTEVQLTNLVTAKIKWTTDKLAFSSLFYGTGTPDTHASGTASFISEHYIELYKLKPDKIYKFMVRAEDIYGNTRESEVYSFSTEKSFKIEKTEQKTDSQAPMRLSSTIFKSERNYLIRLKSTLPVKIEISTYDMPSFPLLKKMSNKSPPDHPPLKSVYETNLLSCETCHQTSNINFSHQVHFRARLGSNIPPEYPRLPNDQTSCLTCHYHHASDNEFNLRNPNNRQLCSGCHKRSFRIK